MIYSFGFLRNKGECEHSSGAVKLPFGNGAQAVFGLSGDLND
jgi:hypothetical protein